MPNVSIWEDLQKEGAACRLLMQGARRKYSGFEMLLGNLLDIWSRDASSVGSQSVQVFPQPTDLTRFF